MNYDYSTVQIPRIILFIAMTSFAIPSFAQGELPSRSQPQQNSDFGSKFFEDLRMLFGRLQQSELDRAFQRASAVHCPDLVGQTGDWKEVAFLNDDRSLGDWHYDKIDDVKHDPTKFVFSGVCRGDRGPVRVATSYPIQETVRSSSLRMRDNDPVTVLFDEPTDSYIFQLPYLYLESRDSNGAIYTLVPPNAMSRPEKDVAEEFRCKALSDPELTYRFLLCRTRVVDRDPQMQRLNASKQPLGNAAYYILSDGKEAGSTVKLTFGPDVETKSEIKTDTTGAPPRPSPFPPSRPPELQQASKAWESVTPQTRLVEVGDLQFRLRFNSQTWNGRIARAQSLVAKTMTESAQASVGRTTEYCGWHPSASSEVSHLLGSADSPVVYSLSFRKSLQSVTSAVFDIDGIDGNRLATLTCYFPQSQNPADITVARLLSIVGSSVTIEVRKQ